jgi:hypothetical protein
MYCYPPTILEDMKKVRLASLMGFFAALASAGLFSGEEEGGGVWGGGGKTFSYTHRLQRFNDTRTDFNPLKRKNICFIQGLSAYRPVNTLHQKLLFILRFTQNTQTQCEHHVEFLNVKPGNT